MRVTVKGRKVEPFDPKALRPGTQFTPARPLRIAEAKRRGKA